MVTDYSGYSQKHIYALARSGNHQNLSTAAGHLKDASEALNTLNQQLTSKTQDLSSSWTGDAADTYMAQTNQVLSTSSALSTNTANTGTLVDSAAQLLKYAHDNVPKPPSGWHRLAHDAASMVAAPGDEISKLTGSSTAGVGYNLVATPGGIGAAGDWLLHEDQQSQNRSVQVMNSLAQGYNQIESQMQTGNAPRGGGSTTIGGSSPSAGSAGGSAGGLSNGGYGGYGGGGVGGVGMGGGGYPGGSGVGGAPIKPPNFGGVGSGGAAGGGLGTSAYNPPPAIPGAGGAGGAGSSLAGAGLGNGAIAGLGGGGGLGGGAGAGGIGGGGSLGKLGGLGALARGGISGGLGKSSMGADGEDAEGAAGAAGAEGQGAGGMMGGAGGMNNQGGEQRGQRAGYLTQDPEYWTGNRKVNPAVIDH